MNEECFDDDWEFSIRFINFIETNSERKSIDVISLNILEK